MGVKNLFQKRISHNDLFPNSNIVCAVNLEMNLAIWILKT